MRGFSMLTLLFLSPFAMAKPNVSAHGMVVSVSAEASQIGVEILKAGGNAADAAVATAFALSVTKAYYGSLGGGGFMLMKFKGHEVEALDHRERAPLQANSDMYLKSKPDASTDGGLAVGTPGVVAGLVALHQKYGKLPWSKVVAPAIALAKNGFAVSHEWVSITANQSERFTKGGMKHYTNGTGKFPALGAIFKQPALAKALELIQKKKLQGFYEGPVAKDVVESVQKAGGILSAEDLKSYKARWMKPLQTSYKNHRIFLMPPPSSGGVLIYELFKLAEKLDFSAQQSLSSEEFHLFAESMARVFRDRQLLGDPDFNQLPLKQLLSTEHIQAWAKTIDPKKKVPVDVKAGGIREGGNTTHYSVIDSEGQTVAATTTLNDEYGSGVVTETYGIGLNNEMDDFTTKPGQPNMFGLVQGEANKVEPRKTPLSSMSPTLVFTDKNELEISIGSPGGPRIISAVFQVVYHALTTQWDIDQCVQAPRVHHQFLPDKVFYDPYGHESDMLAKLIQKGHTLEPKKIARVYAIRRMKNGFLEGAVDAREEGFAAGY